MKSLSRWTCVGLCLAVLVCSLPCWAQPGQVAPLPSPPQSIVDDASDLGYLYYYGHNKSAHTNGAGVCGYVFTLAVASWAGNTSADYDLFRQIRHNLDGDRCLVSAGGYGAQHERAFTASCALIKQNPRLWNQLTATEQHKMNLLMKAALIASAYTTSDAGYSNGQNTDLMGGTNLNRNWNPNFREGMIGGMIVSAIYFGGGDAANDILDNYDHSAFVAELNAAGLTNTWITFNYRTANPTSGAPTGAMIEADVDYYRILGRSLNDLMGIYWELTLDTYSQNVSPGLNGGAGISGYGRIASGAAGLPNVGVIGMLTEFNSGDGGGPRSSAGYAYDGFRPNLMNHIVMLTNGYWVPGSRADQCVDRLNIGIEDLFYKLDHGYLNYSHGSPSGSTYMTDQGQDYYLTQSLWYDVVAGYHAGPQVVGRFVFYNNSVFDGADTAANVADDAAIATDKQALYEGQTSGFTNYTSYSKGINGVMVDIAGGENASSISASDFELTAGNNSLVDNWPPAPAPLSVTVREGDGVDGSDRVTLIWADEAIKKQWLKVRVRANANTGLNSDDVFYFGNAVGETGNSPSDAIVDATDEIAGRNNPRHFLKPAAIDNVHDFNRDGKVDATDEILARFNVTTMTTALRVISP